MKFYKAFHLGSVYSNNQLTFDFPEPSKTRRGVLAHIWQFLTTPVSPSELEVDWKRDRQGDLYLEIYDQMTERFYYFACEQEARIWIEKRYSSRFND